MKTLSLYTIITNKYKYNIDILSKSINNLKEYFNIELNILTDSEDFFKKYCNNINNIYHIDLLDKKIFKTCKYNLYLKYIKTNSDYICLCDSNVEILTLNNINFDNINLYKNGKLIISNSNNIDNFLKKFTFKINWDLVCGKIFDDKYYINDYITENPNINMIDDINIKIYDNIKTLGIYYIATGKYNIGFKNFIKNLDKFYSNFKKTIILLSDNLSEYDGKIINDCFIEYHEICGNPWPIITLFKMYYILKYKGDYDYICYCNADLEYNENFKKYENIDLTRFTATKHNWMDDNFQALPLKDDNPKSTSYIGDHKYTYVNGGFFISDATIGYKMCEDVVNMMKTDIENGIIPRWHDETYLNKWCFTHKDLAQTDIRLLFPLYPNEEGPFVLNFNLIKKSKVGE